MNILYASNDNYVPFLGISLYSLLKNSQQVDNISIYIFSNEISEENQRKLLYMVERFHRKISFIDISDLENMIGFSIDSSGYNITTFARLFADELLPENIDKILYLDSDIIINHSIQELWETDVENNFIAAIPEVYMPIDKKRHIGLEKEDIYYNAGVILINRNRWREENLKDLFLQYYRQMGGSLLYNDQDIINHCCKDRIVSVHPKYNFEPNVFYFPYRYLRIINPFYFRGSKQEFLEMLKTPNIIHFLGDERPWVKGNKNPYSHIFYNYQKESGWDYNWIEGKELYMNAYHVLNVLTRVFPFIRTLVTKVIGINKFKWFGKQ